MATKKTGAAYTRVLADNEHIREFHKYMDAFIGHNHWQVYTDFLQLAADCFIADHTPEHPREKHYMEIMQKYKDKEPGYFGRMLGCVMMYMQETNRECLSEMWEEYAANANLGQFFTPWSVCQFMADLQMQNVDWEQFTPEKKCYISDPSCGGGRTLTAALKKVPQHKLDSVCFHGIDIDANVCYVAALNMLFFNANSYIIHGDALTLEVWHVYRTVHHWTGGTLIEITDPEEMKRIIAWGLEAHKKAVEKAAERRIDPPEAPAPVKEDTPKAENGEKRKEITGSRKTIEDSNKKTEPQEMEQGLFLFES